LSSRLLIPFGEGLGLWRWAESEKAGRADEKDDSGTEFLSSRLLIPIGEGLGLWRWAEDEKAGRADDRG